MSDGVDGANSPLQQMPHARGVDEQFYAMLESEPRAMPPQSNWSSQPADEFVGDATSARSAATPFNMGTSAKLSADVFAVIGGVAAWTWVHAGRNRPRRM
jgi:hypothetical protein